jgi:ferredoxin
LNGNDYFIACPIFEADLVINLPKLKTHSFALYTGAVKNLFGTIPGRRKREAHVRAPGIQDFSLALADVLELVRPGLTIMDGVMGQEGEGPGIKGTPRRYGCLTASADPVAMDTVVTQAMGYRPGEVLHLAEASVRGLGTADLSAIQVEGDRGALSFGRVVLPTTHWYFRAPAWATASIYRATRLRPKLSVALCEGCGRCVEVCPHAAIALGKPVRFDLERCVGCMCCAEVCPRGAIEARRNLVSRLVGVGR